MLTFRRQSEGRGEGSPIVLERYIEICMAMKEGFGVSDTVVSDTVGSHAVHEKGDGEAMADDYGVPRRSEDPAVRDHGSSVAPPGPAADESAVDIRPLSDAHLALVLSIAADAIILIDGSQRILFFNDGAERIFGYAREEVVGRSLDLLLPESVRTLHRRHVERFGLSSVDARRMGERMEISAVRKGGEEFPAEASIAKSREDDRLVFTVVLRDMTKQRRIAEQALQLARERTARSAAEEAERRTSFLARASIELASSLDYAHTLRTVVWLAVPEVADWATVDIINQDGILERLAVEHRDPFKGELLWALAERYPRNPNASRSAGRAIRTAESELEPDLTEAGLGELASDERHLEMLRELGVRSYVVAPLVSHDRILGAMTTISHELRTPLNAVLGYAQLLEEGVPEPIPASSRQHVEYIRLSAGYLLQLIEEILTFSRLEAGAQPVETTDAHISELVDEVHAIFRPLAEKRGLALRAEVKGPQGSIRTDPRKIRQILVYLVENAVKFTDEGEVALEVRRENGEVSLQVRDTGVGVSEEDRSWLFEAFWQAKDEMKFRAPGTGLGLAITERLVTMLGGTITVESEVGRGSTFTVTFPEGAE